MATGIESPRLKALRIALWPLVRFVLRNSHTFQEFVEVLKGVFVDVAVAEIRAAEKKINVSRISVMTGLHRQDVNRLYRDQALEGKEPTNLLQKILGEWEQNPFFTTKDKKPRILRYTGSNNDFMRLVHGVSRNLTPGTVLFELERRGIVERTPRGVKLIGAVDFYKGEGEEEKYQMLGQDVASLITAVEENIYHPGRDRLPGEAPNLHITTEYDNLFIKDLPKIRQWLWEEGKAFHKRARDCLSRFDKDIAEGRAEEEAGGKAVLGTFSFTAGGEQSTGKSLESGPWSYLS